VVCVCPFVVEDIAMFFCCFVKDVRGGNTQAGSMCRNKEPEVSTVPTYQNVSRQLGSKQKVQNT
jgi:hypothetical protein